jgi:hypothetical protein
MDASDNGPFALRKYGMVLHYSECRPQSWFDVESLSCDEMTVVVDKELGHPRGKSARRSSMVLWISRDGDIVVAEQLNDVWFP